MRIGMGYDVHKLVENRDLILGGVKIPYSLGLLGHSDADVLLHAIMDSLLGAAALGDIGKHFPDTDEKYKDISSIELLKHVGKLLEQHNYIIGNIDATIILSLTSSGDSLKRLHHAGICFFNSSLSISSFLNSFIWCSILLTSDIAI